MNTSIHNTIHNTLSEIPAIKLAIVFGSVAGNDALYARLITKTLFDRTDFLPYRNRILEEKRHAWTGK